MAKPGMGRVYNNLNGRAAVVVGSGSKAASLAIALATSGASVVLISGQNNGKMATTTALPGIAATSMSTVTRVRSGRDSCFASITEACKLLPGVDALVTVGTDPEMRRQSLLEVTAREWRAGYRDYLDTVFFSSQAFAYEAQRRQASAVIIQVTSIRCACSESELSVASAAAAAIVSLTRSMALEWAQKNIRVNAVAVGYTDIETQKVVAPSMRKAGTLMEFIPLQRLGNMDDLLSTLWFLMSSRAQYITGQTLFLDGGYSINGGW